MYESSQHFEEEEESDTSSMIDERSFIRVSTAPARPLTDLEEFKRSTEFLLLEQAIICSTQLIQKNYQKYDLDSPEGQKICKKYLSIIEKLCDAFTVRTTPREYRNEFSKAYKILYREGALCYLTEILDSAQEGFPYLWVNGEKYVFSPEVLEAGTKLLTNFFKMQHIMRNAYGRACQENINCSSTMIKQEICNCLEEFDIAWGKFEQLYVLELMLIETDARRYISKAIDLEKELTTIEVKEKIGGKFFIQNDEYTNVRRKLCKIITQINAVANIEGKARDDLGFEIYLAAEGILRRVTKEQSRAVRILADRIRQSFTKLRQLFRKYEQNIEMVDPQLKNNQDLVEALAEYETNWEKGKHYFLDPKKCIYLIHISHIIEATIEKYPDFQEQIECRDEDIFLSIPCLMILKCLDREDKNICTYFLPQMQDPKSKLCKMFSDLQIQFDKWKIKHKRGYEYHNLIEKSIFNIQNDENTNNNNRSVKSQQDVDTILHTIKQLSIELQRNNPMEWNNFLNAALCSI